MTAATERLPVYACIKTHERVATLFDAVTTGHRLSPALLFGRTLMLVARKPA